MSSTNRGGKRRPSDYYPTPSWAVDRLLEELYPAPEGLPGQTGLPYVGQWVEPCAGSGAIIRACPAWMSRCQYRRFDIQWTANELQDDHGELHNQPPSELRPISLQLRATGARVTIGDALEWSPARPAGRFDVCLTNPPYSKAEAFVRWGLANASCSIMLLRLGFLASAQRCALMRENPPDVFVLPNRPSFTANGRTDSADYAWFVWRQPSGRRSGRVKVLRNTPMNERKLQKTIVD